MKWKKMGRIYTPETMKKNGMILHSQNPVPIELEDRVRVFFSCRPEKNISIPTFIDVDKNNFKKIIYCNHESLLSLGKKGTFDEFGIIPTEVIRREDELWMYYTGWQRGINVSYTLAIGLAISKDMGKTFKKVYEGPILDRTKDEPYMTMAPYIFKENSIWHAYYASGIGFLEEQGSYEPQYVIKHAISQDGIEWKRSPESIFNKLSEDESNTRPTVIKIKDKYHMWFCYRGATDFRGGRNSYRIGYAYSYDLIKWIRNDELAGIGVGEQDAWDGEIITYPYVRQINEKYFMFYNGNGFGRTGFGYAQLVDEE